MNQKLPENLPTTDWFRADAFHPALPGYYEVSNDRAVHHHHAAYLLGTRDRYWDGSRWLTDERGGPSSFGTFPTHQWRGRRMWVLRRLAGGADAFLISARPGFNSYTRFAIEARPFKTERQARRFSDRYPRLGLTAVLA